MHTDFTRYVVVNPIYVATSAKTLLRQCHAYGPWSWFWSWAVSPQISKAINLAIGCSTLSASARSWLPFAATENHCTLPRNQIILHSDRGTCMKNLSRVMQSCSNFNDEFNPWPYTLCCLIDERTQLHIVGIHTKQLTTSAASQMAGIWMQNFTG